MPTVIERLREMDGAGCLGTCERFEECNCAEYAVKHLPALLALVDAAKAKDQAAIDKALAELEKEAP